MGSSLPSKSNAGRSWAEEQAERMRRPAVYDPEAAQAAQRASEAIREARGYGGWRGGAIGLVVGAVLGAFGWNLAQQQSIPVAAGVLERGAALGHAMADPGPPSSVPRVRPGQKLP